MKTFTFSVLKIYRAVNCDNINGQDIFQIQWRWFWSNRWNTLTFAVSLRKYSDCHDKRDYSCIENGDGFYQGWSHIESNGWKYKTIRSLHEASKAATKLLNQYDNIIEAHRQLNS